MHIDRRKGMGERERKKDNEIDTQMYDRKGN